MNMKYVLPAILLTIAPANADIITVDLSGFANGILTTIDADGFYSVKGFTDKPFAAEFVYDTSLGTLSRTTGVTHDVYGSQAEYNDLEGGLISATLTLEGFGTWGSGIYYPDFGPSFLLWSDDLSSVFANAGGEYFHLSSYGFQFGLCPSTFAPCGSLYASETVMIVPGPVVGGGLPGLLLIWAGLLLAARAAIAKAEGTT